MVSSRFDSEDGPTIPIDDLLGDLPSGPLDEYRQKASFNWKKLKVLLESKSSERVPT